jgi:hypothetical protein
MSIRTFLFFCCYLLLSLNAHSQTSIKGRTIDQRGALPFVSITLVAQKDSTDIKSLHSDSAGNFRVGNISKGNYTLSFSSMGYQKIRRVISADEINLTELLLGDIVLMEDPHLLKEVSIRGGIPNFSTHNGELRIGIANNTYFKSATNLLDVFKKLPGLQVNQDGTMQMASRATPTIFVDGKPANMNNDEILIYLSSLSPDMVESIEMINQPSAKYDGEYQGIIDVKLRRNQSLGLRGTYNSRFQRNNYSLIDNNLSLVYKANRFIYDLRLGHTAGSTFYKYHALQYLPDANAMTTDTRTATANQNYNAQAKITYEFKRGQNIEAFVRTFQIDRKATSRNLLITQNANLSNTIGLIKSNNNALPKQHNYAGGLNYDAQFKDSELHIVASFAQVDNRQTEDIQNHNEFTNVLLNYWKTKSTNQILIRSAQVDYVQNTRIGKLEFGSKFAYTTTQNDLRYDTLANGIFSLDPKRSNLFKYQEYITAGYLSYIGNWNKFNYRLSVRAEHTTTEANSLTNNMVTTRRYLKWLPSLSITYPINKDEQLTLSYSRRLTRPTFAALNPFRFYYSPRHYWIGNPYLQPSTTNLLSLSFSRKALNISLNGGREVDPMERYPEYNAETNELIFLGRNIPYRDFANIQVSLPITLKKWWRMNNNAGIYYNRELRPYFGNTYKIPIYNYTLNGSQVFSLKEWLLDVSYTYESKSGNGLYIMKPVYGVDFGLQKAWQKNTINTKLTLYDAFDNLKRRLIFRDKTIFNNDFYHYNAAQRLVFSLTVNFGSSTYKARESKKSDEENRVN